MSHIEGHPPQESATYRVAMMRSTNDSEQMSQVEIAPPTIETTLTKILVKNSLGEKLIHCINNTGFDLNKCEEKCGNRRIGFHIALIKISENKFIPVAYDLACYCEHEKAEEWAVDKKEGKEGKDRVKLESLHEEEIRALAQEAENPEHKAILMQTATYKKLNPGTFKKIYKRSDGNSKSDEEIINWIITSDELQ
jgi:peptidyl-tRNA hydrolase